MKKAKFILLAVCGAALFGVGIFLAKVITDPQGMMRTLPYLSIGIGCGIFGHDIGEWFNQRSLQNNPAAARQAAINANDERNIMHTNMAKAKGYDLATYGFAALLFAYALMGETIAVILPLIVTYFAVQFCVLYHRIKIDKEQ
jgi:hypothetical protein